jgi:energy-coupling factor transporter ATP-binding protein EcfA2
MQPIPSHLETTLQRERIGQLIVGRHLLSVGSTYGTLIDVATEQSPTIESQLTLSFQVPRAFSGLLGRQAEIETSLAALKARQHVELCGESGIGKTTLLRHLSHHPHVTTSHADGILYLTEHQPASDRLQTLFDLFYSTTPAYRPSDEEISQALADKQLLILLDDPKLSPEDLQRLMTTLPDSTFVIASLAQRSQGKAQVIELEGLPFAESLALMERELGQSIPSERLKAAESIWQVLQGHPHQLLQTAAMVREDKASLLQVADQLEEGGERSLARMILTTLPKTQR